jgi:hypothetical protein
MILSSFFSAKGKRDRVLSCDQGSKGSSILLTKKRTKKHKEKA